MTVSVSPWSSVLLSLVRIVAALSYMTHGTQKILGWPSVEPRAGVELLTRSGAAGLIEMVGGGLLLVGLFTRPVAFLCSGQMAAAYFLAHAGPALLAGPERRRSGSGVLLPVPVFRRDRWRSTQP